jgi:hypothetical protein
MTADEIASINRERLTRWRLDLELQHATPAVLVGVGHDHREGDLVLCACEGSDAPTDRELALMLRWAAEQLEARPG